MMHRCILLAQYSLLHHSTRRRLVSRPITPPSASLSLLCDAIEGAGEGNREGIGDGCKLALSEADPLFSFPFSMTSFAAIDRLDLFPLPNFLQTWPCLLRCLLSWKNLHMSLWWFFLCSESTAFNSREVHDGAKSGEWKKAENLSSAPPSAGTATLKK